MGVAFKELLVNQRESWKWEGIRDISLLTVITYHHVLKISSCPSASGSQGAECPDIHLVQFKKVRIALCGMFSLYHRKAIFMANDL